MSTERKKDYKIYVFFSHYKVKQSKIRHYGFPNSKFAKSFTISQNPM